MVQIAPFKAIRYNPAKVPNLSLAICPPYDVISVPDYHHLLGRHPLNLVRVELPIVRGAEDRYEVAGQLWERWQTRRALVEDREPSYYGYEQRFTIGSATLTRRGFFAALRLESPGRGHVRPHERTFAKHKEDRLRLMRATQANISPIFGIFFDAGQKVQSMIASQMRQKPVAVTRDNKGVTHRLWRWKDPGVLKQISRALRHEDVLIADGHHRYETAWNYRCERAARGGGSDAAYRYVMAFLCPLSDPGLVIQPTHRAVRPNGSVFDWQARVGRDFKIRTVSSLNSLLGRLRAAEPRMSLAMVMNPGKLYWLEPRAGRLPAQGLPVVQLHERILKDIAPERIRYDQNPRELVESIQRGEVEVAFLLPPPDKEKFARIARAGRLLPQKSTYFFPKLATGLVMRSLQGSV